MTYRATPQPCDPTLESQYMLTNFAPCDAVDDRAARLIVGTPTRSDGSRKVVAPTQLEKQKKTR